MAHEDCLRCGERTGFYAGLIGRLNEDGEPTEGSLLAYAAHELSLGMRQADGATLRTHLLSLWRQSGSMPEQLWPVDCPDAVQYLWEYFCNMNARRTHGEHGPNPITDEGVEAWARRRGIVLQPFENEALDALEQFYLSSTAKSK